MISRLYIPHIIYGPISRFINQYFPSFQIEVNGLVCAGKRIHEILIDADNAGIENVARKYVQECQLMSDLRHPNITQFLGVFPPQLPTPCAADGETGWEFRRTTRDSPQHPSSIEAIHSGERIQGSPLPAQAQSSNHPQGPDGKKCAANILLCGQNHRFWKLPYCEPTAWPAS